VRYLFIGLMAVLLAGCITARNALTADQIASFKLERVDVTFTPDASVTWDEGTIAYAATKGIPADQSSTVASTPEAAAYLRSGVSQRLSAAMRRELGSIMTGGRPVIVQVAVRRVFIVNVVLRVLVGGDHTLSADVTIIDAKTRAVLSHLPDQTLTAKGGDGIGGAIIMAAMAAPAMDRLTENYAATYRRWLQG
jgi:hypothetical protein